MTKETKSYTDLRTHLPTEYAQIRLDAKALGYKFTSNVLCPACEEEMQLAIQTVGYTGDLPQWANPNCAAKFYRKNKPHVIACGCGYRGTMTLKIKNFCPGVAGGDDVSCHGKAVVGERDIKHNGGYCTKCRPYDPIAVEMNKKIKICNRVNCNNPVPAGRTAVCFSCQPPPKEPASSELHM